MAKEKNNTKSDQPVRPIKKIGMVLDTKPASGNPLKFILVQFKGRGDKWTPYEVEEFRKKQPSELFYKLFVLSAKAHQHLQNVKEVLPEKSHGKTKKRDEIVILKPDDKEYKNLIEYFYQIKTRRSKKNLEFKVGLWAFFDAHQETDYGRTITLFASKASDVFYFWDINKFSFDISHGDFPEIIHTTDLPESILDTKVINDIVRRLVSSGLLKKKYSKRRKEKVFVSPEEKKLAKIRESLQQDADYAFNQQFLFGSSDDHIELGIQRGTILKPEERDSMTDEVSSSILFEHGRKWDKSWDIKNLLPPKEKYMLSSPIGTGKTTFLRYLQKLILEDTHYIPVYVTAEEVADVKPLSWHNLKSYLAGTISCINTEISSVKEWENNLDWAFKKNTLVLLIDGLDNLGEPEINCSRLAAAIIKIVKDNPLVMAGRPTAGRWLESISNLAFLQVKPFSIEEQESFFSDTYETAYKYCYKDKGILATPVLASLVKKFVLHGRNKVNYKIKSSWDVYCEMVKYLLWEHQPNKQLRNYDKWVDNIIEALGRISYEAIKLQEPLWCDIPREFCLEVLKNTEINVDIIPSCGFVDLLSERTNRNSRYLVFKHKSFQDFFAAQWALKDSERTTYISNQHILTKWKDINIFFIKRSYAYNKSPLI